MVVATGVAVVTVASGGKAAIAGAFFGLTSGAAGATASTTAAVGTATGVGLSGGAISGAIAAANAGGGLWGALTGCLAGGASSLGVSVSGTTLGALTAGTGGVGLLVLGTSQNSEGVGVKYDCWKEVVRDTSEEPSNGMLLKDVICDPHVAKVNVADSNVPGLPYITLENIWDERFEIEYVMFVESGQIACHARRLSDDCV